MVVALHLIAGCLARADEGDSYELITVVRSKSPTHSRSQHWRPDEGLALEVSGLTTLADGRLGVATRKGEVWLLDGAYDVPPASLTFQRFATALHEPLGLTRFQGSLYVAQRSELTQLLDSDGDDVADAYLSAGKGWGVTGNYHEYAYGPVVDRDGNFWLTLNISMGDRLNSDDRWRGWAVRISPEGTVTPMCCGMRSPCGIGKNLDGDLFFTDQQGNWIATGSLHHLREGAFYGHPDSLETTSSASPFRDVGPVPSGLPWPKAVKTVPRLQPPAVWLPYKKMGQSATDIVCDTTGGKFGPFAGQLFVGEFRLATINRVFLEKINGQYQGACFPFRQGFSSAVVRMAFGQDGSLFAGLTNRGWSSIGDASYGLQRLIWTGKMPFEIRQMHATPDGFDLVFTKPLDPASANNKSLIMTSYTYLLQKQYGSDEIHKNRLTIRQVRLSASGLRLSLVVDGLREGYVHELLCPGLRSHTGERLLHDDAYYTLNHRPRRK